MFNFISDSQPLAVHCYVVFNTPSEREREIKQVGSRGNIFFTCKTSDKFVSQPEQ
jgi:hypothetical protein